MRFVQFMLGEAGRVLRIVAGIVLILVGLPVMDGTAGYIVIAGVALIGFGLTKAQGAGRWAMDIVGLGPLYACPFDKCLLAPLFGAPFDGEELRRVART